MRAWRSDEIEPFAEAGWSTPTSDREMVDVGNAFAIQWAVIG